MLGESPFRGECTLFSVIQPKTKNGSDSRMDTTKKNPVEKKPQQSKLEGGLVEYPIDTKNLTSLDEAIRLARSNFNAINSPSNVDDGDYKVVGFGKTEIDYKDGSGPQEVSFLTLQDGEGNSTRIKLTPRLVEALEEYGDEWKSESFHYSTKGKGFNLKIRISESETF